MAVNQFNLKAGQRAERKLLITVAEWTTDTPVDTYYAQTSEPADWATNYTNYYTKNGDTYVAVTGDTAPTWAMYTYYTKVTTNTFREILGTRTEDSSIEYNADVSTSTDIRGFNYTDLEKTQPQQAFDPFLILGGSKLGAMLDDIRRRNALSELNQFTMYIITAYIGDSTNGYSTEKHLGCTITYDSLGGDTKVNFPITVYFSNNSVLGTVDKLSEDFTFTPDVTI